MSNDVAVLVSGGLDSFVAYHLLKSQGKHVIPLFVDVGQPYAEKEIEFCTGNYPGLLSFSSNFCSTALSNAPTITSQEIFGRNLLLALYGAQVASEVVLSALATEMNSTAVPDKRPEFFTQASSLLSLVFCNKHPEGVHLYTPFSEYTKSDVVRLGLDLGLSKEALAATRSCYDEAHHSCGYCSTCFKRWVALVNNDIQDNFSYSKPWMNPYAQAIIPQIIAAHITGKYTVRFSKQRCDETVSALRKVGYDA